MSVLKLHAVYSSFSTSYSISLSGLPKASQLMSLSRSSSAASGPGSASSLQQTAGFVILNILIWFVQMTIQDSWVYRSLFSLCLECGDRYHAWASGDWTINNQTKMFFHPSSVWPLAVRSCIYWVWVCKEVCYCRKRGKHNALRYQKTKWNEYKPNFVSETN